MLLDSPAGMGKTELLNEVCRELMHYDYIGDREWKIVRLDFRDSQLYNLEDVLEEIARQICRDILWDSILDLVQGAESEDEYVLLWQAASIPMADESREALLKLVKAISRQDLPQILELIVNTFQNVDVHKLLDQPDFRDPELQVDTLANFILERRIADQEENQDQCLIPGNVLLILDSLDATNDKTRKWVINNLAPRLHKLMLPLPEFTRFAIIVSGRFIEQDLEIIDLYDILYLDPFTPDIVEDLILRACGHQKTSVSGLARKLAEVCGGHPGVIKGTVIKLRDHHVPFSLAVADPSSYDDNPMIRESLRQRRTQAINDILKTADEHLFELLSVFRQFNSATLDILSCKVQVSSDLAAYRQHLQGNVYKLFDSLLETRLIWEGGIELLSSDRIILSLMAARMQDEKPDLFRLLNEWAVEIFANWFKGKFADDPKNLRPREGSYQQICLVEWLFHQMRLVNCCRVLQQALVAVEKVSRDLDDLLNELRPLPDGLVSMNLRKQLEIIRGSIERDPGIVHQMLEVAGNDQKMYRAIRGQISQVFQQRIDALEVQEWLYSRLFEVQSCDTMDEALRVSVMVSQGLKDFLEQKGDQTPSGATRQRFECAVEQDQQIDRRMREIALGDEAKYKEIRKQVLAAF